MILDIRCKQHPNYKGKRFPTAANPDKLGTCDACLILYFLGSGVDTGRQIGVKLIGKVYNAPMLAAKDPK